MSTAHQTKTLHQKWLAEILPDIATVCRPVRSSWYSATAALSTLGSGSSSNFCCSDSLCLPAACQYKGERAHHRQAPPPTPATTHVRAWQIDAGGQRQACSPSLLLQSQLLGPHRYPLQLCHRPRLVFSTCLQKQPTLLPKRYRNQLMDLFHIPERP